MASDKGMGSCLIQHIPGDTMSICGGQINEGEPIGTVISANGGVPTPIVGHKRCADKHNYAKANPPVVKIAKQGSDGSIGKYQDAILNPSPLVKPEKQELPPMPEGVQSIANVPFDDDAPPFDPAAAAGAGVRYVPDPPFDPKLGQTVREEAAYELRRREEKQGKGKNIYRDGLNSPNQDLTEEEEAELEEAQRAVRERIAQRRAERKAPGGLDWTGLVQILERHGVTIKSQLLTDLCQWKNA